MAEQARNWFDEGVRAYARYRPDYPASLCRIAGDAGARPCLAVDVGYGNGQFTDHFDAVLGLDPSADQIAAPA